MNTLTPHIEWPIPQIGWPILCGIIAKGGLKQAQEAR
jgi:hypothetical protein